MTSLQKTSTSNNTLVPFVSIIIPVLNAPFQIQACIEALLNQTYPQDRYEIIVVDNGSTDNTPQVITDYPVRMLVENRCKSPYSARNLGIRHANGAIIALTDATCRPVSQWIEYGVARIQDGQADLVGGKITFTFSPEKTVGEMVDSLYNVDVKNSIENTQATVGGNLLVRKVVFDTIGLFPEKIRSGGDTLWTRRATNAGFELVYAPDASVWYPARRLLPLIKKQYRVGRGLPQAWRERGYSAFQIGYPTIRGLFPPSLWYVVHKIRERGTSNMLHRLFAIWWGTWVYNASKSVGTIHVLVENVLKRVQRFRLAGPDKSRNAPERKE